MTHDDDSLTVGIAGLGVIGGSIGLALRANAAAHTIIGYEPAFDVAEQALSAGCADQTVPSLESLSEADFVFVAVPPQAVKSTLEALERTRSVRTVVTDCTGAKGQAAEWARAKEGRADWFVGGHPMAGNEGSGPRFAAADLFQGAAWILTPFGSTDVPCVASLSNLIERMGAEPVLMTAEDHDRHVALLSHLPHAVAAALLAAAEDLDRTDVAAGSWRDLTRVGGSNPALWQQLFLQNRNAILDVLDSFASSMGELREALDHNDGEAVRAFFEEARQAKIRQGSGR